MRFIDSSVEIIEQEPGILGVYKQIEKAARLSYKSEDRITEDSAKKMVDTLVKNKHLACLEHGTIYLIIPDTAQTAVDYDKYVYNQYSRVVDYNDSIYITTNARVLVENDWLDDLKYLCPPTQYHTKRVTVKFTCDIGVSREYNRHRKDSPNEESTRYCNYTKEKFGGGLNIIEPCWLYDREKELNDKLNLIDLSEYCKLIANNETDSFNDIDYWLFANLSAEYSYTNLIDKCGWKAQQARTVLPLDTKTILVHSAFVTDWIHFFQLRALGTTGAPHPQAKELAYPLMEEFIRRNYIEDIRNT
jgi:thymidylate synthase (FAD)